MEAVAPEERAAASERAIAREIRALMAGAKEGPISIAEMGERIGVRRETLSDQLNGKTKKGLPLLHFLRIADELGTTIEEIIRRAHERGQ
jgi:DNA-binding XRE family transcriptional regulator